MAEPCADWPTPEACDFGIPSDPMARTPVQAHAVTVATSILWHLTAKQYGLCEVKVRPCGRACSDFSYYPAQLSDGRWINVTCGCDTGSCGCCEVCEIRLEGPIDSITQVKIGGVILAPTAYRVDNQNLLVRTDGDSECWPFCQDLGAPDTEPNTFSVTYQLGLPVPPGGQSAVAALAAEIVASCSSGPCRLPARVQEIVRQGERIQLINDVEFLRSGLTGLPNVDQWVVSVNPYALRSAPSIWSPDLQPVNRVTTWP